MMIGLISLVAAAVGAAALLLGYNQLRDTRRAVFGQVMGDWVRSTPVDYLGLTLRDHAAHWQRADPAGRRALEATLRARLDALGQALNRRRGPDPLVTVVAMDLAPAGGPSLAQWPNSNGPRPDPADPNVFEDRVGLLDADPADPAGRPALALAVRYRVTPVVTRATATVEALYRWLLVGLFVVSICSLFSLLYMIQHARTLRDRAARESAQAATIDLADRTCHELGNVVFVLANERRNLDDYLDLVERFVAEEPEARRAAARRAGLDPAPATRFDQAYRRELADRGIDPEVELLGGLEVARDVCRQIGVGARYIALTVRELDGYLDRSALPVTLGPIAVSACLDDALALLAPRLEAAGAVVERPAPAAAALRVKADRRLLVHALVNLLKNAVEAAVGAGRPPRVRLDATAEGGLVWITVADDGPGIPADALARIFDLGYSTKGAGRGRGLAIVRESIRAQGGQLAVASPGGAVFRIGLSRTDPS
jgi:signal transduction histidine kinase